MEGREGGGIVVRNLECEWKKQDTGNADVLQVNGERQGWKFEFILAGLDTRDEKK